MTIHYVIPYRRQGLGIKFFLAREHWLNELRLCAKTQSCLIHRLIVYISSTDRKHI